MHSPKVRISTWDSFAGFNFRGIKSSPNKNYFALKMSGGHLLPAAILRLVGKPQIPSA
jgi:hypothetical protein